MIPALLLGFLAALGPVLLRSGDRIEADRVAGVNPQGIEVRVSFEGGPVSGVSFVPWASVRDIEGGWGEAEPYRALADTVHRVERRLARGDISGAGRLLEPLAEEHLALQGPTSGSIASALVLTRTLAGDRAGAVEAWLAWRRSPQGPVRAWIDAETGLCPALPPVWTPAERVEALALGNGMDTQPAGMLGALYRLAAESGELGPIEPPEARLRADPGVRLVWEMARAQRDPEPEGRAAARDALRRRVRTDGGWESAWATLGIGVSLMGEEDRLDADAGAGELVSVLLDDQGTAPGLTDVARDRLIDYFTGTGRQSHADAVRAMNDAALHGLMTGVAGPVSAGPVDPDGAVVMPEELP